jgi:ribonuclease P protein component
MGEREAGDGWRRSIWLASPQANAHQSRSPACYHPRRMVDLIVQASSIEGSVDATTTQVTGSARVSSWLILASTDEKDLSTSQSPTQTNARVPRADGDPRRPPGAQTPPEQGPEAARDRDSSEAARLKRRSPFGFDAADRLHRRVDYRRAQRMGVRFQTVHFALYAWRFPENDRVRLGMAVSRRVGKAVMRNRIKRRIRECFRLKLRALLPPGTGLIVIARTGAGELAASAVASELMTGALDFHRRLKIAGKL